MAIFRLSASPPDAVDVDGEDVAAAGNVTVRPDALAVRHTPCREGQFGDWRPEPIVETGVIGFTVVSDLIAGTGLIPGPDKLRRITRVGL